MYNFVLNNNASVTPVKINDNNVVSIIKDNMNNNIDIIMTSNKDDNNQSKTEKSQTIIDRKCKTPNWDAIFRKQAEKEQPLKEWYDKKQERAKQLSQYTPFSRSKEKI